jgi:hypothetical protein
MDLGVIDAIIPPKHTRGWYGNNNNCFIHFVISINFR